MTSRKELLQSCNEDGSSVDCILYIILYFWDLLLGCLPIIFITADIWRAFKKRKHWIPPVSLVLSSFSLQLLIILTKSLGSADDMDDPDDYKGPTKCFILQYEWMLVLTGRASMCVFMGCLLPAVASPLSPSMWTDMAAFIVSTSMSLLQFVYDIYTVKYNKQFASCHTSLVTMIVRWNVIILVSIIILLVLLSCAALASVGIHQIGCRKIPIILSPQKFNHLFFSWEKVEEHMINSVFMVHSSSPRYILARSILTSPIALITAVSNWILIAIGILIHDSQSETFAYLSIVQPILLYSFIVLGSGVIFWRCITATIHYPRKISWKWSSIKQYFKMENFWLSYLEELKGRCLRDERMGGSRFKKLINKLWRGRVLHTSFRVLIWMQTFSVVFSKVCWLVLQVLLSNKYTERLFMGSASQEFSYLNGEKDQLGIVLGKPLEFDKYCKALLQLPGECPAGIWIANRKSIEYIKKQMKRGEEEGKKCNELMWLLKHKSSPDFSGEKHVKPHQNYLPMRLEVDFDVCRPSFKMAVVSLVTLMAELAPFIPTSDQNNLVNKAIEACSQAWNIMDIVEDSGSEVSTLSKSADKIFENLQKSRTWLGYHLPLSKDVGNSVEAAKTSIQKVVDKGKQVAMQYKWREVDEVAAGYRLYWLSLNLNYQQVTSVEEIVDKMCSVLADVVASSTVEAVGVVVSDCKKWAAVYDEESILKASHVVGKVKNLMEDVEWQLEWNNSSENESVATWRARNGPLLRKYATIHLPTDFKDE